MEEDLNTKKDYQYASQAAEYDVLGCFYANPRLYYLYGDKVNSNDFQEERARFYYEHLKRIMHLYGNENNVIKLDAISDDLLKKYFAESGSEAYTTFKDKYKGVYGIALIKSDINPESITIYIDQLKKYSLIREYQAKGINVDAMLERKNKAIREDNRKYKPLDPVQELDFQQMLSQDIYDLVTEEIQTTRTDIIQQKVNKSLLNDISLLPLNCLIKPRKGISMPFPFMSDAFLGMRTAKVIGFGMLSNLGKTRMMVELAAHTAFIEHKKCLILVNEMTVEEVQMCLLVTIVNTPEYKVLYKDLGISDDFKINQATIATGLYQEDETGTLITKQTVLDSNEYTNKTKYNLKGEMINKTADDVTDEEFKSYVLSHSSQFRNLIKITDWISSQPSLIYIKDVCTNYNDKVLSDEITLARAMDGVEYFFYDTLKSYEETHNTKNSSYADLVATSETLKRLANDLNVFIGFTFQLTDDAAFADPMELNSNYIATAKHIKHNVDGMIMASKVSFIDADQSKQKKPQLENDSTTINTETGEIIDDEFGIQDINQEKKKSAYDKYDDRKTVPYTYTPYKKRENGKEYYDVDDEKNQILVRPKKDCQYYIFIVDKNRDGVKPKMLFEVNLNTNEWTELGIVHRQKGVLAKSEFSIVKGEKPTMKTRSKF